MSSAGKQQVKELTFTKNSVGKHGKKVNLIMLMVQPG